MASATSPTIDRLELGLAAADQRQHRRKRAMLAKRLKKPSSGPKMIEGRKMTASGTVSSTAVSPSGLGARIVRLRVGIGADRRAVGQAGADRARRFGDRAGAEILHGA